MFTMKRKYRNVKSLSVSLPEQMLNALHQAAFDDNRSVSSLVAAVVNCYLRQEGYMLKPDEEFAPRPLPRQTRLTFIQ